MAVHESGRISRIEQKMKQEQEAVHVGGMLPVFLSKKEQTFENGVEKNDSRCYNTKRTYVPF